MPGMPTRAEMIRLYEEKSGRPVDSFDFYYGFGLFRMAVAVQQMYYRYYHAQTRDERFKGIIEMVRVLDKAIRRLTGEL